MDNYLTVTQAAERAGVSVQYIRAEIARGNIQGTKQLDPSKSTSPIVIPLKEFLKWEEKRSTK